MLTRFVVHLVAVAVFLGLTNAAAWRHRHDHSSLSLTSRLLTLNLTDFVATFQIGTPSQTVQATFDTGSSDLWVYEQPAKVPLAYEPAKSQSYVRINDHFSNFYGSGIVRGDWVQDNIDLGVVTLKDQPFGTLNETVYQTMGVMGVGYVSTKKDVPNYKNIPANLVANGVITRPVFSVYSTKLLPNSTSKSQVLFGGIDVEKYEGILVNVPFASQDNTYSIKTNVEGVDGSFTATLDTGAVLSYVPQAVVDKYVQQLNATLVDGIYQTSQYPKEDVVFKFGNGTHMTQIRVSPQEFVKPAALFTDELVKPYALTIVSSGRTGISILGQHFLRSAYVVFDNERRQVSIAPVVISSSSKVVEA